MIELLAPFFIGLATALACVLPFFKNENKRLEKENEKQKNLIKNINDVKKIQNNNSKLSKSDIINKL
jgi:hypothetical protein